MEYEFHLPEWAGVSDEAKDWVCRALAPHAADRLTPMKVTLSEPFLPASSPRCPSRAPLSPAGLHHAPPRSLPRLPPTTPPIAWHP